jgi:hypothetical protein
LPYQSPLFGWIAVEQGMIFLCPEKRPEKEKIDSIPHD